MNIDHQGLPCAIHVMSYRAYLNAKINGAARITLHSPELQELDRLAMIAAKARAFAANNPSPRAQFGV